MAYTPTDWKNREVESPRTFELQNNPNGTTTLIPKEGNVIEAGTPIIADTMNNIEQGIVDAHNGLAGIGNVSQVLETHKEDGAAHGIGNKATLATTHKSTIVGAINEAFQSASDGKTAVANAVTAKGVAASPSDTFPTLATKIGQIKTETPIVAGNQYIYDDPLEVNKNTTTYTKAREALVSKAGTYRVSFTLRGNGSSRDYGMIYVNGQPKGTERSAFSSSPVTFTEDITIPQNATVEIWLRATVTGSPTYLTDFKIGVDTGVVMTKRL